MSKKISKLVSKFDIGHKLVKSLGLPDPSGDLLYGSDRTLSPAEQASAAASKQAKLAEQQALGEAGRAAEAARGSALTQAADAERQKLLAQTRELEQVAPEAPEVELSPSVAQATQRRKRFQTTSVGGTAGGPSIRL